MTQSPEDIVRQFLAAWGEPDRAELARFLSEDAIWVDGAQGVHHGADAILDELCAQLSISRGVSPEIATLVADGATVMVEWHGGWTMAGTWISTTVMAVFEIDNGTIKQMREAYDLQSVLDQMQAAMGDAKS